MATDWSQFAPVEDTPAHQVDWSQFAPVAAAPAPLALNVKPLAPGADHGNLLPEQDVTAGQMPDKLTMNLGTPQETGRALGEQFVGGGGALLNKVQQFLNSDAGQGTGPLGQIVAKAIGERGNQAEQFAGSPEQYKGVVPQVAAVLARGAPTLAATLAVPEAEAPGIAAEAAPTLSKIPGLIKLARTVAEQSPRAAALTALTENPQATPGETARDLAINTAAFGVPASVGGPIENRVLAGGGIGALINEIASRLQGQTPTPQSDLAMAFQSAAGAAAHAPETSHAVEKPEVQPSAPSAKPAPNKVADLEDALRRAGLEIPEPTPEATPAPQPEPPTAPATETAATPNPPHAGTASPERPIAQQWDAMKPEERAVIAQQIGLAGRRAVEVAGQSWADLNPGWQALFEKRGLEPEPELAPAKVERTPEPAQPENANERGTAAVGPVRGMGTPAPVGDHAQGAVEPAEPVVAESDDTPEPPIDIRYGKRRVPMPLRAAEHVDTGLEVTEHTPENAPPEARELVARTRQQRETAQGDAAMREHLREASTARGEAEANRDGLRPAVEDVLGTGHDVEFVRDVDGLPDDVRSRLPASEGRRGKRAGLHDPETGRTFIFTDAVHTPEDAAWTAAHEVAGHKGLRALINDRAGVRIGDRTPAEALDKALDMARQNPTVAKLADVIREQRKATKNGETVYLHPRTAAEEALAEVAAATKTGNWQKIADRYGVDVPKAVREGVKGAVAKFVERLRRILHAVMGKTRFTDDQVHQLVTDAGRYARADVGEIGGEGLESVIPADSEAFDAGREEPKPELPPRAPGESQKAYHARVLRENRQSLLDGIKVATGFPVHPPEAKAMRDIGRGGLRAMWAHSQREADRAHAAFAKAMAIFDTEGKDANLAAIHQWETGQEVTSATHRLFFKAMQTGFQKRIDTIHAVAPGALQNVIENYFPHLWEDPTKAAKWYQQQAAKRPLEGNKAFLKQRVHDTIKDGMAAGLKPVSTNPVDLVLAKMAQMDKFIALHQFRKDLQGRGWLKEMEAGERVPYGYARVDDPAFLKAAGLQGYYAVPELIARDINNHLSPSLSRFRGFRAFRKVENLIMMARLGWSGFHAGFTTLDNLVMHADVAGRYALQGDIRHTLITLAKAPLSIVWSPIEGGKLNRQWLGLDKADVHTAALLDALEQGGARYKMASSDYNNDLPKFLRSLRQRDYGKSLKTILPAIGETGSWLIHHKLVPNQKMAAKLLLAKFQLDTFAEKLGKERGDYAGIIQAMHPDALKQLMGDVVNTVDDRLGQMNYDNQFWNKTAREIAQTVIGAVGWQVGTVRTVTGGVRDLQRLWSPKELLSTLDKEGKVSGAHMGRVSGRTTYLLTLALTMGALNAVTQYMLTGQGPQEPKDYFFPKTGRKNADGSDERLQFPTYWMDHYKLATHPLQTAEHKIHPIFGMLMEALSNQDYYGVQIRDKDAPWYSQAEQVGEYLAKGFVPYVATNSRKASDNGAGMGRQVASFVGVTNAPASVSRTRFQAFVAQGGEAGYGDRLRTPAQAQYSEHMHAVEDALRRGEEPDTTGLTGRDIRNAHRAARMDVPEIRFRKLSIQDKLRAYDMATPAEREQYHLKAIIARSRIGQSEAFRRLPLEDRKAILAHVREIEAD